MSKRPDGNRLLSIHGMQKVFEEFQIKLKDFQRKFMKLQTKYINIFYRKANDLILVEKISIKKKSIKFKNKKEME